MTTTPIGVNPDHVPTVGHHVHVTAGVNRGFTGVVIALTDDDTRTAVLIEGLEGEHEPLSLPVLWLRRDDLLALDKPEDMRTPALVREYTASRVADALGVYRGQDGHRRHIAVVNALRSRSVLD